MVTKTFNSLNDDIKITATILRSKEDNNLTLETSNNLIITSDNLTLNANGDLSVNNINVNGETLQSYIQNNAGTSENVITLNSDASLSNLDITNNLKVDGNLTVNGITTTINSTEVDISDIAITLASNLLDATHLTSSHYAGIDISSIAFLKYYNNTWQFTSSGALTTLKVDDSNVLLDGDLYNYFTKTELESGNLDLSFQNVDISGNLNVKTIKFNNKLEISANYIPTTYSTYKFKTKNELPSVLITDSSGDQWVQDPSYTITTNPFRSKKSAIKIDFKINYICSQEAEQYISFRVLRNGSGNSDGSLVFQDISLGNAMGVTARNIYYGNYIDIPDLQWSGNENTYYLAFKVSKGSDQSLDISSGIYGDDDDYYNYMSVQELYIP